MMADITIVADHGQTLATAGSWADCPLLDWQPENGSLKTNQKGPIFFLMSLTIHFHLEV
jgi:hypothetical protein